MKKTKTSTWFYLLALVCALVAALVAASFLSAAKQETQIIVAAKSLPAYTQITEADVVTVTVPEKGLPADVYKDPQDVIGRYTGMSVQQDAPFRQGQIVHGMDRPAGLVAEKSEIRPHVMVSVPLQKTDLGKGIRPGDHVNIVGIVKKEKEGTVEIHTINNVEVAMLDDTDKNANNGPSIWVLVPAQHTVELHKALAMGTIRCELLPKGERPM